ncbi:MAG: ABC transporter ATP-binding protein [Ectothiorhodospiraceae bacterium]|nr:ABC transporter ATP-binding protein [Ectothiorhodospiraceae bacterium]
MSDIRLERVTKRFGQTEVLHGIDLAAASGEFVVLLGPSGCGKSTMLRLVAGLESVTTGRVLIGGEDVTERSPAARRLSMVFQSYALFPHLDVAENIVFGLRVRRVAAADRAARLRRVAAMVGLAHLLDRKPAQLSGGQRQRVALARAIIAEHPICLMDEPLSNLDAKLRHEMRIEIRALQQSLGMTVVYVTHDQTEAMSMADRVMLMRDGRVEQVGTPDELYQRPATTFTAEFIGAPPMNILTPSGAGWAEREPDHAPLPAAASGARVGIRPEDIALADHGLPVRLHAADYLGADSIVTARVGDQEVVVRVPGRLRVRGGETAHLTWASEAVHAFDATSGRRIEASETQ